MSLIRSAERDLVLGVLHDEAFLAKAAESSDISSEDFDKPVFGWAFENAINFWKNPAYGRRKITKNILERMVNRDRTLDDDDKAKYLRSISVLYKRRAENPDYSMEQINEFVKTKKFVKHMNSAADIIEGSGKIDDAIDLMNSFLFTMQLRGEKDWEAHDWKDGFEERMQRRKHERDNPDTAKRLKFGIRELDLLLPRGLKPGEFGSIAAKTGKGKSIFCNHVGFHGLLQGFNVTHIITENEFSQIEGRYDARATSVEYNDLMDYNFSGENKHMLRQAKRMFDMLRDATDCKLKIVKCIPNKTNVTTIINIINTLERKEGHKTDLLLIDSPDLMMPVTQFKEYRLQRAAVYWELKSYLLESLIIGFATSQLKADSEDTPSPEDVAEAYDKARLLDLLLFLIRTMKQHLLGEASIGIAKTRDNDNMGAVVPLKPDLKRMWIA